MIKKSEIIVLLDIFGCMRKNKRFGKRKKEGRILEKERI